MRKGSRPALATALRMAKRDRATLTIVHVTDPSMPVSAAQSAAYAGWEEREKQSRAWARRQLARMTASVTKAGVHAEGVLAEGSAAREIVRAARRRHSELVVIGTHGRRGLATLFLGSVAAGVVATSACPVMTVRAR